MSPTPAAVWLEGVDLGALDDDARTLLRRRAVGFVFQAFHVLPYLTVAQNVALPLELLGRRQRPSARGAPRTCSRPSGSPPRQIAFRASYRAARSSASPSRARWCTGRGWCSPMSPPGTSIRAPPARRSRLTARSDQGKRRRRHTHHPFASRRGHRRPHPYRSMPGSLAREPRADRAPVASPRRARLWAECCCSPSCASSRAASQSRCSRSRSEWRWVPRCIWSTRPRSTSSAWRPKRLVGRGGCRDTRPARRISRSSLFAELARDPAVRARQPGARARSRAARRTATRSRSWASIPFVAATLQPALIGDVERRALELFRARTPSC